MKIKDVIEDAEQVRSAIIDKVEKIPDEPDLRDVLKYTNRFTLKPVVGKFTQKYRQGIVNDVMLQSLTDADIDIKTVEKFLVQLNTRGVIEVDKLLKPGRVQHWNQIVDPKWLDTVNLIKGDLYNKLSGKIGEKGDVGKGEFLLDILCPEIHRRGAPGDINAAGKNVEVKAGQNGRLGPAGTNQLYGRAAEFSKHMGDLEPQLLPRLKGLKGKAIGIFNPLDNMSAFSEFFYNNAKLIKEAIKKMLEMHYGDEFADKINSIPNQVVAADGRIDGVKLKSLMLGCTFEAYKKDKEFDAILCIDESANKFLYIETAEQAIDAVSRGFINIVLPRWEDSQSNTLKITMGATAGKAKAPQVSLINKDKLPAEPVQDDITDQIEEFVDNLAAKFNITNPDVKARMVISTLQMYQEGIPPKKIFDQLKQEYPELSTPEQQPAAAQSAASTAAPTDDTEELNKIKKNAGITSPTKPGAATV